jgi:hypothetical protein
MTFKHQNQIDAFLNWKINRSTQSNSKATPSYFELPEDAEVHLEDLDIFSELHFKDE